MVIWYGIQWYSYLWYKITGGMNLNVNALSTAIAVALQQAAQNQLSPQVASDQPNLSGTISISQVAGRGSREDSGGNSSSYSTAGAGRSQDMMMMTASESEVTT